MLLFIDTPEFYVIAAVVAAMIVAFAAKPASRGEAVTHLLSGTLSNSESTPPSISINARENGDVILTRRGLEGLGSMGAVSLAITIIGFDIIIEERFVASRLDGDTSVNTATFTLDFLARERYHIRYNADHCGLFASAQINNRPGWETTKELLR